jgi:K+/H+ antiporter YhaU regulatory subunit KhtT
MSFWEKFKSVFGEGVEKVSEKSVQWSNLARLKWEQRSIKTSVNEVLNELGGKVYQLHVDRTEDQLNAATSEIISKLTSLEEELAENEQKIDDLVNRGVDKEQLKEFKQDLELGDGRIEQTVLEKTSNLVGKKLLEIRFPKQVLIGAIVRDERVIIPDGKTKLKVGDKVTLLGEKKDVEKALELLK